MEISFIPKFIISHLSQDSLRQINWNILLSSILLIIALFFLNTDAIDSTFGFCLFQHFLAIPCPGCGITRSVESLMHLQFVRAIEFNPAGILVLGSILSQIPLRMFALWKQDHYNFITSISRILTTITVVTLLIFWLQRLFY